MKACSGSEGIASHILDIGSRWRLVVSFTPRPLYRQGKSPWYPLHRRLGGPQNRSGCGCEEKNSQPPPEIEPPNSDRHSVAQRCTTELGNVNKVGEFLLRGCIGNFPDWVITKYTLTTINTRCEVTQRVMVAKLNRLTHKIAVQLHLVGESCTICSSRSKRPVRKLLDTHLYISGSSADYLWTEHRCRQSSSLDDADRYSSYEFWLGAHNFSSFQIKIQFLMRVSLKSERKFLPSGEKEADMIKHYFIFLLMR
jgi:hypothetical protein